MSFTPGTYISFNDEPKPEPKPGLFAVGTRITFEQVGDVVKSIIHIPVLAV